MIIPVAPSKVARTPDLNEPLSPSLMREVMDVVGMIYRTFNEMGISEKEKMASLKLQLKGHRDTNASMSRTQGKLALAASLVALGVFAAGWGFRHEADQKFIHAIAEKGVPGIQSYFDGDMKARQQIASELSQFLMEDYREKNGNASSLASGPKQDAKAVFDAYLQLARAAAQ